MEVKVKEPVKLRRKNLANGNVSLYLDIYVNGRREYEFLKLYLIPEKSKADRDRNRQTLDLANSVKSQRIVEIQRGEHGFKPNRRVKVLFYDYYEAAAEQRKKKESAGAFRTWSGSLYHLKVYDTRSDLTFDDITPKWIDGFKRYLEKDAVHCSCKKHNGKNATPLSQNTKKAYFTKLRTCLRQACSDGIIQSNPMDGVSGITGQETKREYLSLEELRAMAKTECIYPELKRAFLFSCLTGLRRSDIERLTWGDVSQLKGRTRLVFRQKKTGGQEYLDISVQAAELIGHKCDANESDHIFNGAFIRSDTQQVLRKWASGSGVNKHITFHSGRHTFAVMMLTLGTDIYTVSKLLGHRNLDTTQIYAKIVDAKKQEAVDSIPDIL